MGKRRETKNGIAAAALLLTAIALPACGGGSQLHADGSTDVPGGGGGSAGGGTGGGGETGGGGGTSSGAGGAPPLTGVYRLGSSNPSFCGGDGLQRIWPTRATVYYTGFDCSTNHYVFRPTDGQLFYHSVSKGILMDGAGSTDPSVPTDPCNTSVEESFGFDGQGRLYYICGSTLRRGNVESLATNVIDLAGVLADGRTIVYREPTNPPAFQFEVLGPDGANVNVLRTETELGVSAYPAPGTTTVGNDGYVLLARLRDPDPPELVVYHLDAQSRWTLVRRLAGVAPATNMLVIADGTIFKLQAEPTTSELYIVAYEPGSNTPRDVWREGQSETLHAGTQLLVGPLDAFGPSVKME